MLRISVLTAVALATVAAAQKADISTAAPQGPVRYTIEIESKGTTENAMRRDGEDIGRGMSGPRAIDSSARIVFDEHNTGGARQRTYVEARGSMMMPSRDGEATAREMTSSLVGKELHIVEDDRGIVVLEGGADGEEMRGMGRTLPVDVALAGMTPSGEMEVGKEFDLPAGFFAALTRLSHPIVPEQPAAGEGGDGGQPGRGGRGQPGRGGRGQDGAEGGGQGRGGAPARGGEAPGRGAFAEMRGRMAPQVAAAELALLANPKLEGAVKAKLTAVENGIARIEFDGERTATGDAMELGLGGGAGMFGGGARGGRGGRGGEGGEGRAAPMAQGEGTATVHYTGAMWVDTASHALVRLELTAEHSSKADIEMEMREMVIERHVEGQGKVTVRVAAEPAPAK